MRVYSGSDFDDILDDWLYDEDDIFSDNFGTLDADGNLSTVTKITFLNSEAIATHEGQPYLISQIFDSTINAATAVATFIVDSAKDGVAWLEQGGFSTTMAQWLGANIGNILDGNINAQDAFISLAKLLVTNTLGAGAGNQITTLLDAKLGLTDALKASGITGTSTIIDPATGQSIVVDNAARYANAIYGSLATMGIEFVTSGFDTEQAVKAGLATLTARITTEYLGIDGWGPAGSAAGIAGISTLVNALVLSGDFDGDWVQLGVQVGLAAGAAYVGSELAGLISGFTGIPSDPITFVATAIIAHFGGKLLFGGGKKYYKGEFASAAAVLNSQYQVTTVMIDGVATQALVAVNASGTTIIAPNVATIIGGVGSDVLAGNESVQTILGNGGADYIEGRGGDDALLGGAGNDMLNGGEGADILQGDSGDDLLFGEAGNDTVIAGDGDDFVHLGSGEDIASGGTGRDYILAGGDNDAVSGDAGDDMIDGGYGDDDLAGGTGNDLILGNLGSDLISGDDGNDTLFGAEGNDQVFGGNGADFIDGGEGADILNGENGADFIVGDDGNDFADGGLGDDNITGGSGNDVLMGGMDKDYLKGEAGDDTLRGGFGEDVLNGGVGANSLEGGAGNDIYVIGADTLEAGNVIVEEAGTADTMLLSWLTDANAQSGLVLEQVGDDLKVTYSGRVLATVTDQFVTDHSIETIELANGKFINLAGVTYDAGTHLGTFSIATGTAGTTAADREAQVEQNLITQQSYWNAAYLQKLSLQAYDEQLADQQGYSYYNGTQVVSFSRSRGGLFGGRYTVYKINQAGNIDGTSVGDTTYAVLDAAHQTEAAPFFDDEATLMPQASDPTQTATIYYSTVGVNKYQDIVIGGTVVSSKLAGSPIRYAAGATINGSTYAARISSATTAATYHTSLVALKATGDDLLVGGYWNESIDGKSGADVIAANDGNDTLIGGDGNDWLFGGDGNDSLNAGNGDDNAFGGDGNDNISGGAGTDVILGAGGNDTITGDAGDDWIDAGAENDSVNAGDGDDIAFGGDGDDTVVGGIGNDVLHGGDGNDRLDGGDGNDTLYGGEGYDTLIGGAGIDSLGNVTNDTVSYEGSTAGVNINLLTESYTGGHATGDVLSGINSFIGSSYADTMVAGSSAVYFAGKDGNDSLVGGNGGDVFEGGAGADTIVGGAGIDMVDYLYSTAGVNVNLTTNVVSGGDAAGDVISSIENVRGSALNDTLQGDSSSNYIVGLVGNDSILGNDGDDVLEGGAGADTINGGNGVDILRFDWATAGVVVNLALTTAQSGGDATGDVLSGIENLSGSAYNDTLTGNTGANYIMGMAGNDLIAGGAGADTLDGGDGADIATYTASTAAVNINLVTGVNTGGDAAGDVISNIETIYASNYNDTIIGANIDSYISGGAGNDSIVCGTGTDFIYGEAGADTVDGGAGVDLIYYYSSTAAVNVNLASASAQSGGNAAGDILLNIENIIASNYNDTLQGSAAGNLIYSYSGNDSINGGDGDDTIDGGLGIDTINGGNGADWVSYAASTLAVTVNLTLTTGQVGGDAAGDILSNIENVQGTNYADTLTGNSGANYLRGLDGDDVIYGGAGADTLEGSAGTDFVRYDTSSTAISINLTTNVNTGGDAQGDILYSIEKVIGSSGNDTLIGSVAGEYLNGYVGNDSIDGGGGADTIYGDTGTDWMSYSSSTAAVNVNLASGAAQSGGDAAGDILSGIENLDGSAFNDMLTGSSIANWIRGNGGDDLIYGDAGADTIDGGSNGAAGDSLNYAASTAAVNINLVTGVNTGGYAAGDVISNIEVIYGSSYNDMITVGNSGYSILAGTGNDNIVGGTGVEVIYGDAGADTIDGGAGVDIVQYYASNAAINLNLGITTAQSGGDAAGDILLNIENVFASAYNDTIQGNAYDNQIMGYNGNDSINGGDGNDVLDGGLGADTINGGNGIDWVTYHASSAGVTVNLALATAQTGSDAAGDILSGIENIQGSYYVDTLTGNSAANYLRGLDGDDVIYGSDGADTMEGSAGYDLVDYSLSTSAISINLATGINTGSYAAGDSLLTIEAINASAYNDTVVAGSDAIYVNGLAGNDSIVGGAAVDTLNGGAGADTLDGGGDYDWVDYRTSAAAVTVSLALATAQSGGDAAGDILSNIENVLGTIYNDSIVGDGADNTFDAGLGADTLDGGTGLDRVDYSHSTAGINVSLLLNVAQSGGDAAGDILSNFENVYGSAFDDIIIGSADANELRSSYGADSLMGGDGNDSLNGGDGADTMDGGDGIDTVDYSESDEAVSIDLLFSGAFGGHATGDVISNFENITGSAFADTLKGDNGENVIIGGAGNDTITGGLGQDLLTGGAGNDVFKINSLLDSLLGTADHITDFVQGQDKIDVSALGFTGIDNSATPSAGHIGTYISGSETHLTDGINFDLVINGAITLTNADIIHA